MRVRFCPVRRGHESSRQLPPGLVCYPVRDNVFVCTHQMHRTQKRINSAASKLETATALANSLEREVDDARKGEKVRCKICHGHCKLGIAIECNSFRAARAPAFPFQSADGVVLHLPTSNRTLACRMMLTFRRFHPIGRGGRGRQGTPRACPGRGCGTNSRRRGAQQPLRQLAAPVPPPFRVCHDRRRASRPRTIFQRRRPEPGSSQPTRLLSPKRLPRLQ